MPSNDVMIFFSEFSFLPVSLFVLCLHYIKDTFLQCSTAGISICSLLHAAHLNLKPVSAFGNSSLSPIIKDNRLQSKRMRSKISLGSG